MEEQYKKALKRGKELIREVAPIAAKATSFQTAVDVALDELKVKLPRELRGLIGELDVAKWLRDAQLMDERSYYRLKILMLKDEISYYEYVLDNLEMEEIE